MTELPTPPPGFPPPGSGTSPKRLLWIVNHRTLMAAEVPLLRSLGWEVFIPKLIPDHDPGYRSSAITHEYDAALRLPDTALRVMNAHNFYERVWSPTVEAIVGSYFDVLITNFTYYTTPLSESARKFPGRIVARAFGREHPRTYSEYIEYGRHKRLIQELVAAGDRFTFAQGYANLADNEVAELRRRAHTITLPLPEAARRRQDTWHGSGGDAVFLCPSIHNGPYYQAIYREIKRDFGDLPHVIFGRQDGVVDDPAVLPYMSDDDLFELYARAPVFVYPHTEPRHVHYSPLEAMTIGTPTLYMRGALIDLLAGHADLPGACATVAEMRAKTVALLSGDKPLADAIRSTQHRVLESFAPELARKQWLAVLPPEPGAFEAAP